MNKTNTFRLLTKIQERASRLNKSYHSPLKTSHNITNESAIPLIQPMFTTRVGQDGYDFAMKVLESVSEEYQSTVARSIANNICIGLDANVNVRVPHASKDVVDILYKAYGETTICDRIITNESQLENRYDIDKIVKENAYRPVSYIVEELCNLIDTYSSPTYVKYTVALENIPFILSKNHVSYGEDNDLINMITEYFLMRDMQIADTDYQAFQMVLSETGVLDNSHLTGVAKQMMNNDHKYFTNEVADILEKASDTMIESFLYKLTSIKTESDASDYMKSVSDYIKENAISESDEAKLYFSVDSIHKTSMIDKDFVDIKKQEFFDTDRFDKLATSDMVVSDNRPIQEDEDKLNSLFNKTLCTFTEDSASGDVKTLIDKFKAEQDKSPSVVKRFINKLFAKSPESIIDELPSIKTCIRRGLLFCIASTSNVALIISAFVALIDWLITRAINDRQAGKLLTSIREEKKSMKEKMDNTDSKEEKDGIKKYIDALGKAESKVERYLDSLSDEDHYDDSSDDSDDFDFDFDDDDFNFESAVIATDDILCSANNIMEFKISDEDLQNIILYAAENYIMGDLGYIINDSSVDINQYKRTLNEVMANNELSINAKTSITQELYKLEESEDGINTSARETIIENKANEILNNLSYELSNINENALTTLKLAIQKGKTVLRNIDTKYKSFWQSLDAHTSTLYNSIEKSLTSDRREAIIKGSIIPSFSKCCKSAIALAGVGIFAGPEVAAIGALGMLGASKHLNHRERQLLMDEIETELRVVEKQIDIAQNDGDMNQYRFLLNYQKKLAREAQRIRYGLKVSGRNIPSAVSPFKGGND